ncbi:MAG: 4,5-DOPA dioxygenase extradiol [Bacteroidia bacterium]|nr:4,5-DOPA dioxygenase extradiol [Bacteroidia bacterium]HQU99907.1 4,5-DOPA dioxygenase extradiol [Bacteroidia bacterium]
MSNLQTLYAQQQQWPLTPLMPVLFLGHGSPMNAIEENEFVTGFRQQAMLLPTPVAILCISAHWYTDGTFVTAMEQPRTIHDFGGFPPQLYQVQYPAKGSVTLAIETKKLAEPIKVGLDESWGLDHGAWSVIKHLYPKANIPVVQLSIDYTKPASYHYDLATQLKQLRQHGVLIISSGNIIHNLAMADFANLNKKYGYDWAIEAHQALNKHLQNGNYDVLIDYKKQNKAWQLAIPTPDHYLPLIYALALQDKKDQMLLFNDTLLAGSLSMTSVKLFQ